MLLTYLIPCRLFAVWTDISFCFHEEMSKRVDFNCTICIYIQIKQNNVNWHKDKFSLNIQHTIIIFHTDEFSNTMTTTPPQSHLGRARRHPLWQRKHLPALCTTSCTMPLQMSPIIQPRVCYIHTAVPHAAYTLHCLYYYIVIPPQKKICPIPN